MADITDEQLRKEIAVILKDADLRVMSAKKVRLQLEEKFETSLAARKKEIEEMVKAYVDSMDDDEQSDEEEDEEEEEAEEEEEKSSKKKPAKRPAPAKKSKAKKSKGNSSEDGEEDGSQESEEEEYETKKPVPKKKAPAKKKKGSESDSDSDWGKTEKKRGGGGRGKGGGYTKAKKLSPTLASLMGKDSMPRHEVVKRMWAVIKERSLFDPTNKQFAICDDDLYKVIGTKRFRIFGMMKYLKSHFYD